MENTFVACAVALSSGARGSPSRKPKGGGRGPAGPPFTLSSTAWADGTDIPPKYTQSAGAMPVSPKLDWD